MSALDQGPWPVMQIREMAWSIVVYCMEEPVLGWIMRAGWSGMGSAAEGAGVQESTAGSVSS